MTIADFANLYVTVIEPTLRILAFAFFVIFIVWLFMLLKSGEKKGDMINAIVMGTWKGIVAVLMFFGAALAWVFKFCVRIVTIVFASIRDFFTSEV